MAISLTPTTMISDDESISGLVDAPAMNTATDVKTACRGAPLQPWCWYQSVAQLTFMADSLTQTNSLRAAAPAQRATAARQRSICLLSDKLSTLSATGSDALFAHARSRPLTTRDDRKWRTICRLTHVVVVEIGDGQECI